MNLPNDAIVADGPRNQADRENQQRRRDGLSHGSRNFRASQISHASKKREQGEDRRIDQHSREPTEAP